MNDELRKKIVVFGGEHYGLEVLDVRPFDQGVQNANFRIDSSKGRFVFRVYNRKEAGDLDYVISTLLRLQQENFPSPRLVAGMSGSYVYDFDDRPSLLYEFLPGQTTSERGPALMKALGGWQAKMHQTLANEKARNAATWDLENLMMIVDANQRWLSTEYPEAADKIEKVIALLKTFSFDATLPQGGTHQDVKPENVLIDDSGQVSGIIDFDNGYRGVLLHDITTTIIWYCFSGDYLDQQALKNFLAGYEAVRPLADAEKQSFAQALKFRLLREVIIWYLYVSHDKSKATTMADYFWGLYEKLNINDEQLATLLWK